MKKTAFLVVAMPFSLLFACAQPSQSASSEPKPSESSIPSSEETSEEEAGRVNVFVLSGQSNMEGNTQFDDGHGYLADALNELNIADAEDCYTGMPEIQTSYYLGPAFNMNSTHGSNPDDKMAGKFLDTVLGMGADEKQFGPEIGAAYVLRKHAKADKPIYFIKSAFGGSGFGGGWGATWNTDSATNLYKDHLKVFVQNNLRLIENIEGVKPTIRGLL